VYTPSGFGTSELGDIEVVPVGDDLHLFHLTLPNHDVIQHAVSHDGLSWRPLPAALRTGNPGAIDDDQIWTMSVTPRPDGTGWVMLYTALGSADHGRVQRVAIAESPDLLHWRKHPEIPAVSADPQWYEADPAVVGTVSWRDPKPVHIEGGYLATICAREANGPLPRRGCVGLLFSSDLRKWAARPPLFTPRRYWDLECPQLFRVETASEPHWVLIASVMEDRSLRYWLARDPLGPFRVPPGGDILAPAGHYAARATRWQDRDLLFAWHQPRLHQGWPSTPQTVDWVEARNPFGKFLAPPLEIVPRRDGSLGLHSFAGWQAYEGDTWRPVSANWHLQAPSTTRVALSAPPAHNFQVRGELTLEAARGGLAFRMGEDESSGLFIELTPGSRNVTLQRWGTRQRDMGAALGLTYEVLQQAELHEPLRTHQPIAFTLLNVGPYVELSVNGEIVLATMTGCPAYGSCGVWVEDGELRAENVHWVAMRQPAPIPPTPEV
jgi:beta-fructofuranosidase